MLRSKSKGDVIMGLFGPSKKEKVLQAEVERLSSLMLPEHREIDSLN